MNVTQGKKAFITPTLKCQLCLEDYTSTPEGQRICIDARVNGNGWAWMCEPCFDKYGCELGTGRGQIYHGNIKVAD